MSQLVNKQLASLYNGVSQQPSTLRLESQGEIQVNCYDSVEDGKRKRPPSEHVAKLAINPDNAYIHTINRDATERYIVVVVDGDLAVYDMEGNAQTVAFPHGKTYLNANNARSDFALVSVADYTFVVNKTRVVNMLDVGEDTFSVPTDYWWLNREVPGMGILPGVIGETIGAAYRQYLGNPPGGVYRGVVQSFQDLPDEASNGDIYEIAGTQESAFTRYYVRRNGAAWDETVKPGLKNRIDETSMPHALVRKSDGTFEFGPFSWAMRRVGDENTNKNPSFVGRTIRDVFFYKNRLGFTTDENVVLSRAGDFGNFYRLTVLDLLDDEVIDVATSTTQVTKLNFAVPFANKMMAFSDQVQFAVQHGDVLKPTGCSLDPATHYKMVPNVRPLGLGSDVYFASEAGADGQPATHATIHEYFVRSDNANQTDAADVTAHVPRYIPAGVHRIAGSDILNVLFVLTSGAPNRIYVYKFYWTEEDGVPRKAQSSWSYWEFGAGDEVLSAEVLDSYLYVVIKRADGAYLERINLATTAVAPGLNFQLFLDRRVAVTGVYLHIGDKTEFTLPYPIAQGTARLVLGAGHSTPGALLDPTSYTFETPTKVVVPGNKSAAPVWVGECYEQRYTFSPQHPKNAQGVAILTGSLVLSSWAVHFVDTAYFKTEVAPYGTDPDIEEVAPGYFSEFTGRTLGTDALTLGTPIFGTGSFSFGVRGDSKIATVSLVNDTPYNATFQQAEYVGMYTNHSRTI